MDAGGGGKLLEFGSCDAKPRAAVTALATDFKDGFSGVVRCLKLPEIYEAIDKIKKYTLFRILSLSRRTFFIAVKLSCVGGQVKGS